MRRVSAVEREPETVALFDAMARRIEALEASQAALAARVTVLEAGRGDTAGADHALARIVATSTGELPFRASWLMRHARADPLLQRALHAAFLDDTSEAIGCWLRRAKGTKGGDVRIERLPGRQWRAVHIPHMTCSADEPSTV